jgi:hypothetical protein
MGTEIRKGRKDTLSEIEAWYEGNTNWGFGGRTHTKVLLSLYRVASNLHRHMYYYTYDEEEYNELNKIRKIQDALKLALSNRENVYSKGANKVIRKLMAKHKLNKELAIQLAKQKGICVP